MPLQSSGTISLGDIRSEFNLSGSISFGSLYRNGGAVTANNSGVPTSGTIDMNDFYYNTSTGNGLRCIETGSTQPYSSSSATSLGYAYYSNNTYYLSSGNWKLLSNNANFNPCGSNYNPNYGGVVCEIINIPQVTVDYYLRCWAGGQNTALSCHSGNLYNNRNCGGSYQYCGSGLVRSNYTGYLVTGACWGEVSACSANNGNATWSGSCNSFTVDSCYGNDPSAVLTINFNAI